MAVDDGAIYIQQRSSNSYTRRQQFFLTVYWKCKQFKEASKPPENIIEGRESHRYFLKPVCLGWNLCYTSNNLMYFRQLY